MEHLIITGGERYLPFARSRIKALRASELPYAGQQYEIDGVTIRVRIEPGHEYIFLSGTALPVYEFFSTGPVLNTAAVGGFPAYLGYGVSVVLDHANKTVKGKPAGSTLTAPPEGLSWKYSPDAAKMGDYLPHRNGWQLQGANEHQYFPSLKPPRYLLSTWTGASQINRLSTQGRNTPAAQLVDTGYDVAPSLYSFAGKPAGGIGLAPDADWYRRAAVRTVTDPKFGSRTIILMTDASGTMYAYPTTEVLPDWEYSPYANQQIKTNVPAKDTQAVLIPVPAWARATPSARDGFPASNADAGGSYRWAFNSTATRAVCILAQDTSQLVYANATYDDPALSGGLVKTREAMPGLVEVDITLGLSGPNPEDFTFGLVISNQITPTSGTYVIAADYYWGDLPGDKPTAARDALLYMTMDVYHQRIKQTFSAAESEPGYDGVRSVAKVIDSTSATVLREFTTHVARSPYATTGVPYTGSFLEAYHTQALSAKQLLNKAIFNQGMTALEVGQTGLLGQGFVHDTNAYIAALTTLTPASITGYDAILQKYLSALRDYVRGLTSISLATHKAYDTENLAERATLTRMLGASEDAHSYQVTMLACDLRVLGFALQQAAFKDVGNQTTRQDRLTVIMRNAVVQTTEPDSTSFGVLIDSFAAPWTPSAGWLRLSVTAVSNPSLSVQGLRTLAESNPYVGGGALGVRAQTRGDFNVYYPYGAVAYNQASQSFLSMCMADAFCVHPAGHWALATAPIVTYVGASTQTLPLSKQMSASVDTTAFLQQVLDIASFRLGRKVNGQIVFSDTRTTHLALVNQAYGLTTVASDYDNVIANDVQTDPTGSITEYMVAVAAPANPPVPVYFPFCRTAALTSAYHYQTYRRAPSYFNTRDGTANQAFKRIDMSVSGRISSLTTRLDAAQPVLRGSAVFGGPLTELLNGVAK